MHRKDFVKSAAFISLGLSPGFTDIKKWYSKNHLLNTRDLAPVSDAMENDFRLLLQWMKDNGWSGYLSQKLNVNLDLTGDALKKELIKKLDGDKLAALRNDHSTGYDDFSGEQLIQPGFPAYSLLFHTMAGARVKPGTANGIRQYPTLAQIDLLENYIYALCDWEQLKSIYSIRSNNELVFAVFAYEYRPAFKTPHHAYADLVYSRTGIGRIGGHAPNYDAENRCYVNKPKDDSLYRQVAVIPARYGLFIARKVKYKEVSLVRNGVHKCADAKEDTLDAERTFLQPIRKLFNNDELCGVTQLQFREEHVSEKLYKLAEKETVEFYKEKPQKRSSEKLVVRDPEQQVHGSSFLVISIPQPMVRQAAEGGKNIFFKVPPYKKIEDYENRYFTAYATQLVEDVELLDGNARLSRLSNDYSRPRNQPLFINITNIQQKADKNKYTPLLEDHSKDFEAFVDKGNYMAPLFEDSICDGFVTVTTSFANSSRLGGMPGECLPAFSVITAPDFFPQVDPLDLLAFDIAPGTSAESSFYEGGVASLSTARIMPNPKMINTGNDNTGDTYLAVLSASLKNEQHIPAGRLKIYSDPAVERDYTISGFLPDVASSVFAPGWDVTYCRREEDKDIYVGTEGLGSPFVEDMKFCSALNGMWPATSPDAARTFQGGNEARYRNPTAIPLMDSEIGICKAIGGAKHECTGWDGEQGPYLQQVNGKWKVNFTDLGRSDTVYNATKNMLDMSKLRELKSSELIMRMDCLKRCIQALPQKNFRDTEYVAQISAYTYLWLISAEPVNWGTEDALALGIPKNLVGAGKDWIVKKENAKVKGKGYLFLFANTVPDQEEPKDRKWTGDRDNKRRWLDCVLPLYICEVTKDELAWGVIDAGGKIKWKREYTVRNMESVG